MMALTPDYKIINQSTAKDVTGALKPFIIALSLTESADNQNDTLSIKLNGLGVNQFPVSGTHIEVHIGYKETELVNFGSYKVDTKTLSGMPLVLTVKAGQSDFTAPIKTQKSRHFDQQKLGDILDSIAKENLLELSISNNLAKTVVPYMRQDQESDMNLIARLAREYSANGTIKAGKLVFQEKARVAKVQTITPSDLIDFSLSWTDKPKYDSVIATWHDRATNTQHQAIYNGKAFVSDQTGVVARTKEISNNLLEAQKQAQARWHKLNQLQLKASMTLIGNPRMVSKLGLKLQGFIAEFDDSILFVSSVRHDISSGYKTTLELSNQSTNSTTA